MDKQEKIQRVNDSIQNTMSSTIGIEITDIDNDFICGKMRSNPLACCMGVRLQP